MIWSSTIQPAWWRLDGNWTTIVGIRIRLSWSLLIWVSTSSIKNCEESKNIHSQTGTPSLSGTATLLVNIINSNDKNPYFTPATQRAEVAEDAPIGTVVYHLIALDPDVESSELLDYAATEPITAVDKDGKEVRFWIINIILITK